MSGFRLRPSRLEVADARGLQKQGQVRARVFDDPACEVAPVVQDVEALEGGIEAFHRAVLQRAGGVWFDFEQLVREVYCEVVRPGDRVLDVGANNGDHTFQLAPCVGARGKVIAVEAAPDLAAKLRRQLATHYPAFANIVTIIAAGAYDRATTASFFQVPGHGGLNSLKDRPNVGFEKVEGTVELVRLDDVVELAGEPISFVKMDIEGAELFAMRGAVRLLDAFKPVVVFEFDVISARAFDYDAADLLEFLRPMGYRVYDFFGVEMERAGNFERSQVWNYVAFPEGSPLKGRVLDRLRKYMLDTFGVDVPTVG